MSRLGDIFGVATEVAGLVLDAVRAPGSTVEHIRRVRPGIRGARGELDDRLERWPEPEPPPTTLESSRVPDDIYLDLEDDSEDL